MVMILIYHKLITRGIVNTNSCALCPHNLNSTPPYKFRIYGVGCLCCIARPRQHAARFVRFPQHKCAPAALQATSTLHGMRRQRPPGYPPLYNWKALHGAGLPFIKAAVAARALYLSAVASHHARRRSRTSSSLSFDLAPCLSCISWPLFHFFPIFRREKI